VRRSRQKLQRTAP